MNILITGANSGIGLELAKQLDEHNLFLTYRSDPGPLLHRFQHHKIFKWDVNGTEQALDDIKEKILIDTTHIDWIINTIGVLELEKYKLPERRIKEYERKAFLEILSINTLSTLDIAKAFESLLIKSESPRFVSLSAKVGSISDNKTGGWYSYRASKAALNMVLKNLSIELQRRNKHIAVIGVHPGTTETELTKNFIENARKKYHIHSASDSARNIIKIIRSTTSEDNGQFLNWDRQQLPW